MGFENLFYDLWNAFILENAAVCRSRQKPEPRHDLSAITGELARVRDLNEPADKTVEIACPVLSELEANRDVLPEDLVEVDLPFFAPQLSFNGEEAADRLLD